MAKCRLPVRFCPTKNGNPVSPNKQKNMATQNGSDKEILDYILQAQKHGLADFEIKQNLLNAGWDAETVEKSFVKATAEQSRPAAQQPQNSAVTQEPHTSPVSASSKPVVSSQPVVSQPASMSQSSPAGQPNVVDINTHSKFSLKTTIIFVVVILLLAGGAYGYYNYFSQNNPQKVWEKFTETFTQTGQNSIYNTKFKLGYSDKGELDATTSQSFGFKLKDINLELEGSGYMDAENKDNPQTDSQISYSYSSGNTLVKTGVGFKVKDQILYINLSDNPILSLIGSELERANDGKKVEWIKIDLNEIQKQSGSAQSEVKFIQNVTSPNFKNDSQRIWEDTKLIKMESYLGKETLNGVTTLHFKNSLDKQALKTMANGYVDLLVKAIDEPSETKLDDVNLLKDIVAALIDKITIKEFEIWVGAKDFKRYRVHLVTNAPSVVSLIQTAGNFGVEGPLDNARSRSREAKRLADVRQIATALELYYNDKNHYPESKDGKPLDLTPTYIGILPQAAKPADGSCTDYYNDYWYEAKQGGNNYTLTFCLGGPVGGYSAGIAELSPSGIRDNIACPSTQEQCNSGAPAADPNAEAKQQVKDFIDKLMFSAELKIDEDYSDYGKKSDISVPADAFDVMKMLNQAQSKSVDAKRLADVRQMASALELYFNDKSQYPSNLNDLVPSYIGLLPTPPVSVISGVCGEAGSSYPYTYNSTNLNTYTLDFCLDNQTGGYSAGKHVLSPAGIQ